MVDSVAAAPQLRSRPRLVRRAEESTWRLATLWTDTHTHADGSTHSVPARGGCASRFVLPHLFQLVVECVEQKEHQFLCVLLGVVVELGEHGAHDGPSLHGGTAGAASQPHLLQQADKHLGHLALGPAPTKRLSSWGSTSVNKGQKRCVWGGLPSQLLASVPMKEVLHEGHSGTQAL